MTDKVYIQNLERGLRGNCVVWWRPNSAGYTTHLDEAGLYPVGFATESDDIEVPQALAESLVHSHVDGCMLTRAMNEPNEIDVDGVYDPNCNRIRFIGKATRQADGTWRCLADVDGALCIVELNVSEKRDEVKQE